MNLAAIRAALAANITAVVTDATVTGYLMTPPEPPCFEIDSTSASALTFRRGGDEINLIVRGILALNETIETQKRIDEWLDGTGGESVKAAIESDRTLGGACEDLLVTSWRGPLRMAAPEAPNGAYLCAEWSVQIIGVPS